MSATCGVHGKLRTLANLEETPTGEYRCKTITPCKGVRQPGLSSQDLAAAGHTIIHPEGPEVCHAHGKQRGSAQLYQVMTISGPRWECLPEARCKQGQDFNNMNNSNNSATRMVLDALVGNRYSPYSHNNNTMGMAGMGMGGAPGIGGLNNQLLQHILGPRQAGQQAVRQGFCFIHKKKRHQTALQRDASGRMVCLPTDKCKVPGSTSICSIHSKQRKLDFLESDDVGGMRCTLGNECQ
eukprot:TRINITY_DN1379_c0_g1_i1.p1 TRINITY_DN1379_c0_g1~~TRINITY_DN1379_c0_g1_i1.p1  ORF type:complete len:239 (+),score=14.56 TRINITY_DN1379_c0_g1_i1:39-755(+)